MLPLIPTLALSFVSFIASAFVILRIVIPILPPHPLSRRVPPSEFGLPNFKSLSPADKSHIWLAACDILALSIFVWQAVSEAFGGPSLYDVTYSPLAAIRLWFALTLRQSCLLVVASLTLLHVRIGRPVSFGEKHWMLWSPTLLLIATSTALAGVLAGAGLPSFFYGLVAYSATLAVLSSVAFGCLIGTLIIIKRNIAAFNDLHDPWPPAKEVIEKPRPSFATDDVNGLKDGSSWITSRASSRQGSISAFSFSTHHSRMPSNSSSRINHPAVASHPSIPSKSSYWFNPGTPHHGRESPIPPVPPLPAPYRPASPLLHGECDPFRRDGPRRVGSQSSWLTEPSSDQTTLSAWSFPPSRPCSPVTPRLLATHPPSPDVFNAELFRSCSRSSSTPIITSNGVLGGYGYSPGIAKAEGGSSSPASSSSDGLDVSVYRTIGWLLIIWIPFGLSLPYFLMIQPHASLPSPVISLFLVLSATLSSPILACNILLRSPIPIPSGLFDSYSDPPSVVMRAPSPATTLYSREYKGSASITVVESRRSGDVWVSNGDAVDGRSKLGRAFGMLSPNPKLAVLPSIKSSKRDEPLTPPLPIKVEDVDQVPRTPRSENLEEMGVRRNCSEASSYMSGVDTFATQIMVAERHYSTLATTMVLPPSPDHSSSMEICATGVESSPTETKRRSGHLRVRSIPSTPGSRSPISPPPSTPLPPTPPSIKNLQASHRLTHRKSASSSVYSFGAIDTTAEIDALSAGLLPLLVPGLKFGGGTKVRNSWRSSHGNQNTTLGGMSSGFSSPDLHSTPLPTERNTRTRKVSGHKRQPHSLPLLNLDKEGATGNWRKDVDNTLEKRLEPYNPSAIDNRRNTVQFDEFGAPQYLTITVKDEDGPLRSAPAAIPNRASLGRSISMKTGDGLSPLDIPESANPARNSLVTLLSALDHEFTLVDQDNAAAPPPSANSDVTLFEFNTSSEGPQAESTPHESNKARTRNSGVQQAPPPVPPLPSKIITEPTKRSSITYVKSDENAPPTATTMTTTTTSTTTTTTTTTKTTSRHGADKPPATIAEPSSRIRPLNTKSKTNKLPYKAKASHSENGSITAGGPPKVGLRPLSLLKDRDVNQVVPRANTQPLVLGKKHHKKVVDENAGVVQEDSPQARKGLRPLKLARSETTKQRAMLREVEDLPQVVIRPPSVGSDECF